MLIADGGETALLLLLKLPGTLGNNLLAAATAVAATGDAVSVVLKFVAAVVLKAACCA